MSKETIDAIKDNVDELGSFFSFFKKGQLKEDVFSSLDAIGKTLDKIPNIKKDLKSCRRQYSQLDSELDAYKKESEQSLKVQESTIAQISSILDQMKNKELLISSLLSSKSNNEGLDEYKKALNNDFIKFANNEKSLANEAEAILKLQAIEKELSIIIAYPQLYKKNVVAVGGGFSAGKSEFISSFFNSGVKLPIGIAPTTAIPTYVMNTLSDQIIACNHNGGLVDLQKIDEDFHSKISHEFIKSFDFNLKEIMPLMIIGTQIEYENICFIDTPGYNPAQTDDDYSEDDINTAKEFLGNASTFIWLIGADANGTIPSSDLSFLSELELKNKTLYIVYNKADLRSQSDIDDVLEEIVASLDDYEIEYKGISAFSSLTQEEYAYRNQSLFEFINENNFESQVHLSMIKKLYNVYKMYKQAILTNIKENEAIKSHIKSISLDMLEEGFDDTTKPAFQRLDKLSKIFATKKHEDNLKRLDFEIKKLKDAIDKVFECESSIDFEHIQENEIEINFDFEIENMTKNDEILLLG